MGWYRQALSYDRVIAAAPALCKQIHCPDSTVVMHIQAPLLLPRALHTSAHVYAMRHQVDTVHVEKGTLNRKGESMAANKSTTLAGLTLKTDGESLAELWVALGVSEQPF